MKILYFAWIRAKIGIAAEDVAPPVEVTTVGTLLDWLAARGPNYAEALKTRSVVKTAVNQEYVDADYPVKIGDEIALFPPVTGG
ncbi:MAG TPA: molybdopterin converting factor subunit 1 [Dongiaceae bacterium]|nr:molybdopterin converting factor subunit 1 [Dongiaceae bacterium]